MKFRPSGEHPAELEIKGGLCSRGHVRQLFRRCLLSNYMTGRMRPRRLCTATAAIIAPDGGKRRQYFPIEDKRRYILNSVMA